MNFGLALDEEIHLEKEDEHERLQFQMYHYITKSIEIRNKNIVEVGCGRGGGCYFLDSYREPRSVVGVDISTGNIKIAKRISTHPGVLFFQGDAENLKLSKDSVDVVLNLESCHLYPHPGKFIGNVHSILKKKGHFVLCDILDEKREKEIKELLLFHQFAIVREEDITDQVIRSMEADNERKLKLVKNIWFLPERFNYEWAGIIGSSNFNRFKQGKVKYKLFVLQK